MRRLVRIAVLLLLVPPAAVVGLAFLYRTVPPVSVLMLGRWLTGRGVERSWVPLARIAPALPAAVIASEDARFCRHGGVDWDALRGVMGDADGPSRGASTIPMQTAKNLFLWPGRSYLRKGLELPIALLLDVVWPKTRTLEIYLNIAEWGDGVFGAEAAARRHFGRSARDLSRTEATLLAAALPNPLARDPARPSRALRAIAARIGARIASTPLDCLG